MALTDHDTLSGCAEAKASAVRHGIDFIAGIEISCNVEKLVETGSERRQLHILGLDVDMESEALKSLIGELQRRREDRAFRTCDMITRQFHLDPPLTMERIRKDSGRPEPQTLGRPHFARWLVDQQLAESVQDAFNRFLGDGMPCCVSEASCFVDPDVAIRAIHEAGGVAVWAHPHQTLGALSEDDYRHYCMIMKENGIDGLEVDHRDQFGGEQHKEMLRRICGELHLIETNGSDFHDPETYVIAYPPHDASSILPVKEAAKKYKL